MGTNVIASFLREYRPFQESRTFVRMLNLKSGNEWNIYCHSNNKPEDIPLAPQHVYKDVGWISMGDWLGTDAVAHYLKDYRSFQEARDFVHKLSLKSRAEWKEYCKSGKKPNDIPSNPNRTYKDDGWISMGDWLGTGTIAPLLKKYRSFVDARDFVRGLHFKGDKEWRVYVKSGKKPDDIPTNPNRIYKNEGWKNLGDWLGTGNISNSLRVYRSFNEARTFIQTLHLKNVVEWRVYCKSVQKPNNIPSAPNGTYKNQGWINWADWLGK